MAETGREGGLATKAQAGREHYQAIGRRGGKALAESRGPEFFREIGRKGRRERSRSNAEAVGEEPEIGKALSGAPEVGQTRPIGLPEWLKSPISLDACAHSLGISLDELVEAAQGGKLLAVQLGAGWFTDRALWAVYRAANASPKRLFDS